MQKEQCGTHPHQAGQHMVPRGRGAAPGPWAGCMHPVSVLCCCAGSRTQPNRAELSRLFFFLTLITAMLFWKEGCLPWVLVKRQVYPLRSGV